MTQRTTIERKGERELVVTRTIRGPARLVFEAFSRAELFQRWWVPKSFGLTLVSCTMDVRVGGTYRLVFRHGEGEMAFFGRYLEVTPHSRIVWTNEESGEGGPVTTALLEEQGGSTRITMIDLFASAEAREAAMESGEKSGMDETFSQLEELLPTLGAEPA